LNRFFVKTGYKNIYVSNITGEWIYADNFHIIEDKLFDENHRLIVEVLEPIFISNMRNSNK